MYEGRALVNSVTAEDERLDEILPLVARHGAAVIGLANDETGIPETPEKRLEMARKIVTAAGDYGIAAEDVVIDPLAMTVGADTEAVTTTLETISLIRDELGVNMCLGASNVSFGLPRRHVLNAAFLPMAMAAGLTSAIMSTAPCASTRCGRPTCCSATTPGAQAGSPPTALVRRRRRRPRRLPPHDERSFGDAPASSPRPRRSRRAGRRRRASPPAVPARRRRGSSAERHAGVRRRELERDRDRLDLRRPRNLQEVQGSGRLGRRARRRDRPARVHAERAARGMAAGVPGRCTRRPRDRGAAAADAAEGSARGGRPPRDPAPVGAEATPRARRADTRGSALRPPARARRDRRPRAADLGRVAAQRSARPCDARITT